jgi:hypothetical protein
MKNDTYTKAVLTIIAICLLVMTVKQFEIPKANAASPTPLISSIPVNLDGSINVNVKSMMGTMDVNLEEVGGYSCYGKVPVVIKENEDK